MLSVEEALERILAHFHVLESEERPLLDALGQVLAEDATARRDIPPLDNSAMDGYAIQAASVVGASENSPVMLKVVGAVAAGQLSKRHRRAGHDGPDHDRRAHTARSRTLSCRSRRPTRSSAATPAIASTKSAFKIPIRLGADIRPAGQDVRRGDTVLTKETTLRPAEIGVLASLGLENVTVVRRPVVAILATGNELLEAERRLRRGQDI